MKTTYNLKSRKFEREKPSISSLAFDRDKFPSPKQTKKFKLKFSKWLREESMAGSNTADLYKIVDVLTKCYKNNEADVDLTGLQFKSLPPHIVKQISSLKTIKTSQSIISDFENTNIAIEYLPIQPLLNEKLDPLKEEEEEVFTPGSSENSVKFPEDELQKSLQDPATPSKIISGNQGDSDQTELSSEFDEDSERFVEQSEDDKKDVDDLSIPKITKGEAEIIELGKRIEEEEHELTKYEEKLEEIKKGIKDILKKKGEYQKIADEFETRNSNDKFISDLIHESGLKKAEEFSPEDELDMQKKINELYHNPDDHNGNKLTIINSIEFLKIFTNFHLLKKLNTIPKDTKKNGLDVLAIDILMITRAFLDFTKLQDHIKSIEKLHDIIATEEGRLSNETDMAEALFKMQNISKDKTADQISQKFGKKTFDYIKQKVTFHHILEIAENINKAKTAFALCYAVENFESLDLKLPSIHLDDFKEIQSSAKDHPEQTKEIILALDKLNIDLSTSDTSLYSRLSMLLAKNIYGKEEDKIIPEVTSQDYIMDLKDKIEKISLPLFDRINLQGLETRKIESINKQILNCKIQELSKLLELQLTKMNSEQPQKITVDEESLTKSLEKSLGEILSENKLKLKKPINTPKPVSSPSRLMRCFGNSSSKD